ncbi:hypothetical protein NL64_27035 [Pseudomonas fluorescens]|nr:hypothetical protein NL64_27035 [Pseudomonas fluorescens]
MWARALIDIMGLEANTNIAQEFLATVNAMDAEHIIMQIVDIDLRLDLFNVRTRTLLLSGAMDRFVPSYCMPEINNEIPSSTHVPSPFLGYLLYLEDPMNFNSRVDLFQS